MMPRPHLTRDEAFLSTPSARRATPSARPQACRPTYFYPRPPRGGRRPQLFRRGPLAVISIHALREEGDFRPRWKLPDTADFYPRPPRGGRRFLQHRPFRGTSISIHALREEGDRMLFCETPFRCNFYPRPPRGGRPRTLLIWTPRLYFYPRPPRGGRLIAYLSPSTFLIFLSTPSARRATGRGRGFHGGHLISIHALREEGDGRDRAGPCRWGYFYPRPPRGGRHLLSGL